VTGGPIAINQHWLAASTWHPAAALVPASTTATRSSAALIGTDIVVLLRRPASSPFRATGKDVEDAACDPEWTPIASFSRCHADRVGRTRDIHR